MFGPGRDPITQMDSTCCQISFHSEFSPVYFQALDELFGKFERLSIREIVHKISGSSMNVLDAVKVELAQIVLTILKCRKHQLEYTTFISVS